MVGVVNPNATMSLDVHRQAAKAAAFVLQPGDKWPTEGPDPSEDTSEDGHDAFDPAPSDRLTNKASNC